MTVPFLFPVVSLRGIRHGAWVLLILTCHRYLCQLLTDNSQDMANHRNRSRVDFEQHEPTASLYLPLVYRRESTRMFANISRST